MVHEKRGKILKIAIPAMVVAVIVAIALIFIPGPEKTVKKYLNSMIQGDGEAVYKLVMNPYELNYRINSEHYSYSSEQDIINEFASKYRFSSDVLKTTLGDKLKTKIKITNITKYSKSDIAALNKYLSIVRKDIYEENSLQDVRLITAETTINGSKNSETRTDEIVVYKLKNKWYVSADAFCPSALANKESINKIITRYGGN